MLLRLTKYILTVKIEFCLFFPLFLVDFFVGCFCFFFVYWGDIPKAHKYVLIEILCSIVCYIFLWYTE